MFFSTFSVEGLAITASAFLALRHEVWPALTARLLLVLTAKKFEETASRQRLRRLLSVLLEATMFLACDGAFDFPLGSLNLIFISSVSSFLTADAMEVLRLWVRTCSNSIVPALMCRLVRPGRQMVADNH